MFHFLKDDYNEEEIMVDGASKDRNAEKMADLAGPGIGDYDELEKILPRITTPCLIQGKRRRPSSRSRNTLKRTSAKNST